MQFREFRGKKFFNSPACLHKQPSNRAFRAVQFDWMVLRFAGVSDKNNMRATTGLLCRF